MTDTMAIQPPSSTFATRLRAAMRIDIGPTLVGGAIAIVLLIAAQILLPLVLSAIDGMGSANVINPPTVAASVLLVLTIIMTGEAAPGRREGVAGGWTRAERLQMVTAIGAGMGVLNGVVWLALAAASPALQRLADGISYGSGFAVSLGGATPSVVAALMVALMTFGAAFVPGFFGWLARVHWSLVVLGAGLLYVVAQVAFIPYALFAEPTWTLFDNVAHTPVLWAVLAVIVVGLFVAGCAWLALRAPVSRYRP
ncbi:hypothetical protein [Gulosibacter molinativorax]|uniref:ABC transporter permease n=1 Tax=Gulosibacter molinativorax TaxID=256821 RepID=A0ABT7CAL7_9MICO|nr:hypothetical protein [Gulosibacter molinativorax]MDJ1372184.1 hypothetical protein [Gulosibacter molinativorax]QUY60945.1 Hypotetical protein [Gulosibacter molinativorax]